MSFLHKQESQRAPNQIKMKIQHLKGVRVSIKAKREYRDK